MGLNEIKRKREHAGERGEREGGREREKKGGGGTVLITVTYSFCRQRYKKDKRRSIYR